MALGTSLFLIAVGAILRYAVSDSIEGIELGTIGLILMVVGVVGMVISLFQMTLWDRDRRRSGTYPARDPHHPADRDPYA
jgi:Domain of unknown function (DUF6458)